MTVIDCPIAHGGSGVRCLDAVGTSGGYDHVAAAVEHVPRPRLRDRNPLPCRAENGLGVTL